MKKIIRIKILTGTIIFMSLFLSTRCTSILEEQPRVKYTPEYFKTERGVIGALNAMYVFLRDIYGQAYYYNICLTGTDEATWAQSADSNFKDADMTSSGQLTPSTSRSDVIWNVGYTIINTANGVIEYGTDVIDPALIAESHFFRAFHYFLLTQTFGGVPLDIGSGELEFNITPSRTSVRNTVPEVYTKVIFPDLLKAVEELPDDPRLIGAATKTVARLHLAKAYLTYGWWLENPRNIPTYPACDRTDPDGHNPQWYFQQAYDVAVEAIDNPGRYGLQPTFYDVNLGQNDRNNEILLFADHTENSEFYNGASLTYGGGSAGENFSVWMMTWNYTNIRSLLAPNGDAVSSVQREASQPLGRPWIRMCPTIGVIENTFADKTNDSRYDGTFTTVYRGNWHLTGTNLTNVPTLYNANNLPVSSGDAILTFLPNEDFANQIIYPSGAGRSNVGAGEMSGRSDYLITPRAISRLVYPGLWKLGTYRTDNAGGLGQPNAASTRPYNIAKFSEFYLIAAEAAVKGANTRALSNSNPIICDGTAKGLVNVLRWRAGQWRWDNGGNTEKIENNGQTLIDATPATIDINYILAERSREFYGEGYRWFDLVRTQTWEDIGGKYEICGQDAGEHTPEEFTRTIQPHHYLRPVPQGQIDGMEMTDAEKDAYQNPGYN
jgi:hypothetical protein